MSTIVQRRIVRTTSTPAMAMTLPLLAAMLAITYYLLPLFSSSGESCCCIVHRGPKLPRATQTAPLVPALIVTVTDEGVAMNGVPMPDDDALLDDLHTMRSNWALLHPDTEIPDRFVLDADGTLPFRRIADVLRVARRAGFGAPDYLVVVEK